MRIADEVLNRLINGEDPVVVKGGGYRSQSQISLGFRLYLEEQEKRIKEIRAELVATQEEQKQRTIALDQQQHEKKELSKDVESLKSEKAGLRRDVDEKRMEFESLRNGAEKLQKRGFTLEIVERLGEDAALNGTEVWRTLHSREERARLDKEIVAKQEKKIQVEREISQLEAKEQKITSNVASKEKRLAAIEAQLANFGEVADLVDSGLKSGYTLDDFRALLSFLLKKRVGLTPGQSIGHLLQLVEAAKTQEDLRTENRLAENMLSETLVAEKQAKARVEFMEETVVKAIEAQKAAGVNSINEYASRINEWMRGVMLNFRSEIDKANANSANNARLELERVQLEKLVAPAQVLLGLFESEDALRAVRSELVIQLLERLQWWLELRWPKAGAKVFQDMVTYEYRLSPPDMYEMKIASLLKVTIEAIRRQLLLEEKSGANSVKG